VSFDSLSLAQDERGGRGSHQSMSAVRGGRGQGQALRIASPACEEAPEVQLQVADVRSTLPDRSLDFVDPGARGVERVGIDVELADELASAVEGNEELGAEVLGNARRGAGRAGRLAEVALDGAEEAFELVRRRRDPGVVEAHEEVGGVASRERGDVIDELAGGSAEAGARSRRFESLDIGEEARFGLATVRRSVGALRVRRDDVREVAEDLDVALDAPGGTRAVPVGLEGLGELVKERSGRLGDVRSAPPLSRSRGRSRRLRGRSPVGCGARARAARVEPSRSRGRSRE